MIAEPQTRTSSLALTPLELQVMKVVWLRQPVTVKTVHISLYPSRPLAYTTILTVMQRMYAKGLLRRHLKSRAHYYESAVAFDDVRAAAVAALIEGFFQGSRDELLAYLSGGSPANGGAVPAAVNGNPPNPRATLDETLL
jgi:predicted transcriptional regulator